MVWAFTDKPENHDCCTEWGWLIQGLRKRGTILLVTFLMYQQTKELFGAYVCSSPGHATVPYLMNFCDIQSERIGHFRALNKHIYVCQSCVIRTHCCVDSYVLYDYKLSYMIVFEMCRVYFLRIIKIEQRSDRTIILYTLYQLYTKALLTFVSLVQSYHVSKYSMDLILVVAIYFDGALASEFCYYWFFLLNSRLKYFYFFCI